MEDPHPNREVKNIGAMYTMVLKDLQKHCINHCQNICFNTALNPGYPHFIRPVVIIITL